MSLAYLKWVGLLLHSTEYLAEGEVLNIVQSACSAAYNPQWKIQFRSACGSAVLWGSPKRRTLMVTFPCVSLILDKHVLKPGNTVLRVVTPRCWYFTGATSYVKVGLLIEDYLACWLP